MTSLTQEEIIERVLEKKEKKNSNDWIKYFSFLITLVAAIVYVTLYVADRPNRDEVKEMINDKVEKRLENIEKQVEQIRVLLMERKDK